jgi:phospholipase C
MSLRQLGRGPTTVLAVLGLLVISGMGAVQAAPASATSTAMTAFDGHVSHIVFLLQENHAFDNLFGTYCPVTGPYCKSVPNGIPSGTCVPLNPKQAHGRCVVPYNFPAANLTSPDMPHDWNSTHLAYNGGAMNGFYKAELYRNETFGHYNGTTAPVYWDLAEQYALGDNFFSSAMSYSLPNHWFLVSAKPPAITLKQMPEYDSAKVKTTYLAQANGTPTIAAELANSSVSWNYFDYALPSYSSAITASPPGDAYDFWNPLAAQQQSYAASMSSHFVPRTQFFSDAANGTLPDISWVIPSLNDSDHPTQNLTTGQSWVASVVDAVEASPEWNSTVLFVSWDEYGGFYDHVTPPSISNIGDGFRVPLLAIGPYVRQGYLDHREMSFSSILHLIELRFGLPCLGQADCRATLPLDLFNFGHAPRAPIQFHAWANSTYPMPLQSSGKLPPFWHGTVPLPMGINGPEGVPSAYGD